WSEMIELRRLGERLQDLDVEYRQAQYLRIAAELSIIRERIAEEEAADARIDGLAAVATGLRAWSSFPVHLRDTVIGLTARRNQLLLEVEGADHRAMGTEERLRPLEADIAAAEERVKAL